MPARTMYYDGAYAPFGESYVETGTTDRSFTGQMQDTTNTFGGLYDFTFRKYSPVQGRWISPDPAGVAAVDISNPQTWNEYEYAENSPITSVDMFGLSTTCDSSGCRTIVWAPSPDGPAPDTSALLGLIVGHWGPGAKLPQLPPRKEREAANNGHTVTPNQPLTSQQQQCVQSEVSYADRVRADFLAGQDNRILSNIASGAKAGAIAGVSWGATAGAPFFGVGAIGGGAAGGVIGAVAGAGGAAIVGTGKEVFNQFRYDNSFLGMPSVYASTLQSNIQSHCGVSVNVQ